MDLSSQLQKKLIEKSLYSLEIGNARHRIICQDQFGNLNQIEKIPSINFCYIIALIN